MAELSEVVRRREIRRRKILDNSEARWQKIVGLEGTDMAAGDQVSAPFTTDDDDASTNKVVEDSRPAGDTIHGAVVGSSCRTDFAKSRPTTSFPERQMSSEASTDGRAKDNWTAPSRRSMSLDECKSTLPFATALPFNGSASRRTSASQAYAFPKKVSDAETRSYGRTKADAQRISSCTQLVQETLLNVALLRTWVVIILSFIVRLWLIWGKRFTVVQSLFLPFVLVEFALYIYYKWNKVPWRSHSQSVLVAALILCGIPSSVVTQTSTFLYSVQEVAADLAIYMFSFVLFHLFCEDWMCPTDQ